MSGLTTALQLSRNPSYKVTVVAKHMPGDYDIEYTVSTLVPHSLYQTGSGVARHGLLLEPSSQLLDAVQYPRI